MKEVKESSLELKYVDQKVLAFLSNVRQPTNAFHKMLLFSAKNSTSVHIY